MVPPRRRCTGDRADTLDKRASDKETKKKSVPFPLLRKKYCNRYREIGKSNYQESRTISPRSVPALPRRVIDQSSCEQSGEKNRFPPVPSPHFMQADQP